MAHKVLSRAHVLDPGQEICEQGMVVTQDTLKTNVFAVGQPGLSNTNLYPLLPMPAKLWYPKLNKHQIECFTQSKRHPMYSCIRDS